MAWHGSRVSSGQGQQRRPLRLAHAGQRLDVRDDRRPLVLGDRRQGRRQGVEIRAILRRVAGSAALRPPQQHIEHLEELT